ncbi:hypothetical protein N7495_008288 [Penicillium taxi]|uniref:uncharacterized protein n=1 Tax=Penicillium taxi TaxID=168475 RepID=UPI0025451AC1|nr:uncharacterized protein N7495_008288 [Penicillium taxi]KAJ5888247.1 hypothetical protein N7495_008288 [Penicillium taxi]
MRYHQIEPFTSILSGVRMMQADPALAVKLKCSYLRRDDENGFKKRDSDLTDALFWAEKLKTAGQNISESCAKTFRLGFYNILLLRKHLSTSDFEELVDVGLRKLLLPWEENSQDQKEYYLCFADEGTDPFTVSLVEADE